MTVQIVPVLVFDAEQDYAIAFRTTGNQPVKHKVVITDRESGDTEYTSTVTTFRTSHTIPANSLTNGGAYECVVTIYDADDDTAESAPVSFLCRTTPSWGISISEGELIRSTRVTFSASFSQDEGDQIDSYHLYVYTSAGAQIAESPVLYAAGASYQIDLDSGSSYYARAYGNTVAGFVLDTGRIYFSVQADAPQMSAIFTLNPNNEEGTISIASNIIAINGHSSDGAEVSYVTHGDDVCVVSTEVSGVVYDEGFQMDGDFVIDTQVYLTSLTGTMMMLGSTMSNAVVILARGKYNVDGTIPTSDLEYLILKVDSGGYSYVTVSSGKGASINDKVEFIIKRQSGRYEIYW